MISKNTLNEMLENLTLEQLNKIATAVDVKTATKKPAQIANLVKAIESDGARVRMNVIIKTVDKSGDENKSGYPVFIGRACGHKDFKSYYTVGDAPAVNLFGSSGD